MSRVSYTQEYSDGRGEDKFPKIKLDRGETKRILCLEAPWSEYVHDLRLPDVREGQLMWEVKKRKDQSEYSVPATKWLANVICVGDKETLKAQGLDEINCPACAGSKRNSHIPAPKRRYAMNVVEYATHPNGQLAQPFGARFVVWAFTAKMFDELIRISNDHSGQLQSHDLRIGPPEEPVAFQRYPINALPSVAWQEAGQAGFTYLQALANAPGARATDDQLRDHCGTLKPRAQLESDVERCIREWVAAESTGAAAAPNPMAGQQAFAAQQAMGQGFNGLLQGAQPGFGAPGPQQGFQPAAAQAGPFGTPPGQPSLQGTQPQQFAPPPQGNPFALTGQPAPHPLESQAAMASAQQQQMQQGPFGQMPPQQPAPQGNPFGAPPAGPLASAMGMAEDPALAAQRAASAQQFQAPPQQPAPQGNPFGSVQPVQGAGGLAEFAPQTTSNPSPDTVVQLQQQGFPPPGMQPGMPQQGFPPQPGAPVPGNTAPPADVSFSSFFPPPGQ